MSVRLALAAPSLVQREVGAPTWYPPVITIFGPAGVLLGSVVGIPREPR